MLKHGALGQLKSLYGECEVAVANTLVHNKYAVFCVKKGALAVFVSGPYHASWSRSACADVFRVFVIGHGFGYVHDIEFVSL